MDWSKISVISKLPVAIARCSCRGSRVKDFSTESICKVVRSIRLSPILARILGGVRPSFPVSPLWYVTRIFGCKEATGEPNGSSSVFVAGLFSRIGDGFQQNKFSCRSIVGEPGRLVDTAGLYTEPLHLASTQPSETARRNPQVDMRWVQSRRGPHHAQKDRVGSWDIS